MSSIPIEIIEFITSSHQTEANPWQIGLVRPFVALFRHDLGETFPLQQGFGAVWVPRRAAGIDLPRVRSAVGPIALRGAEVLRLGPQAMHHGLGVPIIPAALTRLQRQHATDLHARTAGHAATVAAHSTALRGSACAAK